MYRRKTITFIQTDPSSNQYLGLILAKEVGEGGRLSSPDMTNEDNEVSEGEGLRVGETLEFAVAVGTTTYAIEQQIGYSGYLYWRGHSFFISELSE